MKTIVYYPDDYTVLNHPKGVLEHLQLKHDLCFRLQPKIIVELGVRAGYSAQAFMQACPTAQYFGFDANTGTCGGAADTRYTDFARVQLAPYNAVIDDKFDTQKHDALPIPRFDLAHVDADHSTESALHDLDMCCHSMGANSVMLIDDFDMDTVARAVYKFLDRNIHMVGIPLPGKDFVIFRKENVDVYKITAYMLRGYNVV
jgi:predicted O-methyltransferase YrrM